MARYTLLIAGAIVWIFADQLTKIWAVDTLLIGDLPEDASEIVARQIAVTDGWFNFRLVGNKGAAWGLFARLPEGLRVPFFLVLTAAAIVIIVAIYRKATDEQWLLRWALTFILGGAIGNFIDRLVYGYVIDFIDWYYGSYHWPTFNVADIAIAIGVGLLVVDMLFNQAKTPVDQAKTADESNGS